MSNFKQQNGQVLIQVIVFSTIAVVLIGSLIGWAGINIKSARQSLDRERAIELAESGIDYYRWHLAHAPTDYKDGVTGNGPYVHSVVDKNGNVAGQFSLNIIAPAVGSTKVRIESTGTPSSTPSISRKIAVELAIPSLAKYAVVANDNMRFGQGTEVFGPIHSNGGIRFDGLTHNMITSGQATYTDPDHVGGDEYGVHTHVLYPSGIVDNTYRALEASPTPVQARTDVFQVGRTFPAPVVDFVGLTTNLATIKSQAQSSGRYLASSGAQGYYILLKTNDTFDVYKVTSLVSPSSACQTDGANSGQLGWGSWSINNKTFVANYAIPANGLIFVEDHVWVEGAINTARVTIASGKFPDNANTRTSITVNNNLTYTNYNGTDVISLIAQNNVNAGLVSADTLRIDAALVAQNGRVGRYYYSTNCATYYTRSTLTLYGMIASNVRYGFAYTGTSNTGYVTRNLIYDANLLYGPPPSFPLTSNNYEILSWEEMH